jgi:hypothetical protein
MAGTVTHSMKGKQQSHEPGSQRAGSRRAIFAGMLLIIGGVLWLCRALPASCRDAPISKADHLDNDERRYLAGSS